MPRHKYAIAIDRPAGQVFRLLLDPQQRRLWDGGLLEVEVLGGSEIGPGQQFRDVYQTRGGTIGLRSEVVAYEPDRRIQLKLYTDGGFAATTSYELEEREGRTVLRYRSESHYAHPLAWLLSPLVSRAARKKLRADFDCLKALVEGGPASPAPSGSDALSGNIEAE